MKFYQILVNLWSYCRLWRGWAYTKWIFYKTTPAMKKNPRATQDTFFSRVQIGFRPRLLRAICLYVKPRNSFCFRRFCYQRIYAKLRQSRAESHWDKKSAYMHNMIQKERKIMKTGEITLCKLDWKNTYMRNMIQKGAGNHENWWEYIMSIWSK